MAVRVCPDVRRIAFVCNLVFAGLVAAMLGLILAHANRDSGAREVASKVQIEAFRQALERYREDVGSYPSVPDGLEALRYNPGVQNWRGPYLEKAVPVDPWGKPFLYGIDESGRPIVVDSKFHQ